MSEHYNSVDVAVQDVLYAAWKFDDKPHQLFSAIMKLADSFDSDPEHKAEVMRLMQRGYDNIGTARTVWSDNP